MKKWVVYLILHSFLVLCACQPTPEQPAITEKQNTGSFLEQAGMQENGKHFRDMDIPDGKYVFSTTGLGGRLSIDVGRNRPARCGQHSHLSGKGGRFHAGRSIKGV